MFIAQCTSGPPGDGTGGAGGQLAATTGARRQRPRHDHPLPERAGGAPGRGRTVDGTPRACTSSTWPGTSPGYDSPGSGRPCCSSTSVARRPRCSTISIPNTDAELYGVIDRVLEDVDVL